MSRLYAVLIIALLASAIGAAIAMKMDSSLTTDAPVTASHVDQTLVNVGALNH